MHQLFTVGREQGIGFVTATGDENPIHREGDVVPGAMTSARAISSLEALFPRIGVRQIRFKFRSIARYGRPLRQQIAVAFPAAGELQATVRIEQEGQDVAEGVIVARIHPEIQRPNVGKWRVDREELRRVEAFFRSLAIAPELYLHAGGSFNYSYPRGFLASLPSGEMVRRLSGDGAYLTNLELTFPDAPPPGITGSPEVWIQKERERPTFSRILTLIKHGLEEQCRGFALVFSPKPAPDVAL